MGHLDQSLPLGCNALNITATVCGIKSGRLPRTGNNSYKRLLRPDKIHERFRNLAKDPQGQPIPLIDFETMTETHLAIWKVHIYRSFQEGSEYSPKFRILNKAGTRPKLTVLRMRPKAEDSNEEDEGKPKGKGKGTGKVKGKGKGAAPKPGGNDAPSKAKTGAKGKFSRKRKRNAKDEGDSEDDAEVVEGSDNASYDERPLPQRSAQQALKGGADALAAHVSGLLDSDSELDDPWLSRNANKQVPVGQTTLQPSDPGVHRSPYFQTATMAKGTLPKDWRRVAYSPELVSSAVVQWHYQHTFIMSRDTIETLNFAASRHHIGCPFIFYPLSRCILYCVPGDLIL